MTTFENSAKFIKISFDSDYLLEYSRSLFRVNLTGSNSETVRLDKEIVFSNFLTRSISRGISLYKVSYTSGKNPLFSGKFRGKSLKALLLNKPPRTPLRKNDTPLGTFGRVESNPASLIGRRFGKLLQDYRFYW